MKRNVKNIIMILIVIIMIGAVYFTISMKKNDGPSGIPPEKPDGEITGDMFNDMMPPSLPDEVNGNQNFGNTTFEKPNMMPTNSNTTTMYILLGIESLIISSIVIYLIVSKFNKKTFNETYSNKNTVLVSLLLIISLTIGMTYLCGSISSNNNEPIGGISNGNSGNQSNVSYSANYEINSDESITTGSYTSSNEDENAIIVSGNVNVNLSNINISKLGDSIGGDSSSFYGNNSALLAKDGAIVNISNVTIETNASEANGVFSYGGSATTNNSNSDGTTINISDSKITTNKDNSGGIMTTGGGIMNANNLVISTSGRSSAAIRTDRGGGIVTVNKGTYNTSGTGSPVIYSTADITVNDAELISTSSEGIVIEGANSVTLNNCLLTDTNNTLNGQSTTYKNIFLYQSMSGDAKEGGSVFTSKDSTITTNKGDSFYITNTTATINLENNNIINNDKEGYFLRSKADSWGNNNSNGGKVTLNLSNQKVTGNIYIDNVSSLIMNMNDSSFEGMINGEGVISIKLDSNSTIKLMGDTYVNNLDDEDESYSNIDFNGYKLYVNNEAIN